jgi:HSP20 family protein
MTAPVRPTDTELARWDPSDFGRLGQQLSRLFDQQWPGLPSLLSRDGFTPLADVEETDDAYLIDLELPGVNKKDVDIEVNDGRLIVTGERREKERVGLIRRQTRTWGRFRYEVRLPSQIDEGGIEAHLDDGVLHLRVPKNKATARRRIEVG